MRGFAALVSALCALMLSGCASVGPTLIRGPNYTFTFQLPDSWRPLSEALILNSRIHEFGGPSFRLDAAYSPRSGARLELPVLVTGILADTRVGRMAIPAANAQLEEDLARTLGQTPGAVGLVFGSEYFPARRILLVESGLRFRRSGVSLRLFHAFYYTRAELFMAYGVCREDQTQARETLRRALLSAFIDPGVSLEQTTELAPPAPEKTVCRGPHA